MTISYRARALPVALAVTVAAGLIAQPAAADDRDDRRSFAHVGSFYVDDNLRDRRAGRRRRRRPRSSTSPTTANARLHRRVHRAARLRRRQRPGRPAAGGAIDLPGAPTSVAVHGRWALVVASTRRRRSTFDAPTGQLLVIDLRTRAVVRTIELAGQPDSIAVAPSGRYAAIVIENERDEDDNDGLIPQLPGGSLQVLDLAGGRQRWTLRTVALTGLADIAPEDPEPEYVDINTRDQAVVSLQENNHLVDRRPPAGRVTADFSAGTVDIDDVDTTEESLGPQGAGVISLDGSLDDRRREPDAVQWIDDHTFATANEGDYVDAERCRGRQPQLHHLRHQGRGRVRGGQQLRARDRARRALPRGRSENKGNEPEGLEVGRYRGRRTCSSPPSGPTSSASTTCPGRTPRFLQLLPTGIGPEGLHFDDGVLAVTAEVDGADEGFLARPIITLFELERGEPAYPYLRSADEAGGLPIPWVAMSGLAGDPEDEDMVWAVSDSVLAQAYLYRIDVSETPAVITERLPVGGVDVADQTAGDYDLEGVAARPEGGFWLASEGRTNVGSSRPEPDRARRRRGRRAASRPAARVARRRGDEQRLRGGRRHRLGGRRRRGGVGGDPAGVGRRSRLRQDGSLRRRHPGVDVRPLPARPADRSHRRATVVGLSELTLLPDGTLAVIERDNQLGQDARIKRIYAIDPASVDVPARTAMTLPVLDKELVADVLDDLDDASISVPDKLEGLAVTADGHTYVVTDNDGVDENYGETIFLRLRTGVD